MAEEVNVEGGRGIEREVEGGRTGVGERGGGEKGRWRGGRGGEKGAKGGWDGHGCPPCYDTMKDIFIITLLDAVRNRKRDIEHKIRSCRFSRRSEHIVDLCGIPAKSLCKRQGCAV